MNFLVSIVNIILDITLDVYSYKNRFQFHLNDVNDLNVWCHTKIVSHRTLKSMPKKSMPHQ